jgi:hypothetical protein
MVGDAAQRAGSGLGSAYESSADAAVRASQAWSDSAMDTSRATQARLSEWGGSMQETLAETFERQPLLLGAVGVAIGAAIAAALPSTELENRMMGEKRDSLKQMAEDLLAEKGAQAKAMAQDALREAERQGLTPEAAAQAVQEMTQKAAGVAEKARATLSEKATQAMSGDRSRH